MTSLALAMVLFASPAPDAFERRGLLAADRLAVAAVDPQGSTRSPKELWWSGEGQQVLELLDHRACLGTASGCQWGGALPIEAVRPTETTDGDRSRYEMPGVELDVVGWEIVGTEAVLWSWRQKKSVAVAAAAPVLAEAAPVAAPNVAPPSSPVEPLLPALGGLVIGLLVAFGVGRRRRSDPIDWAEIAEGLQGELEQVRLRHEVETTGLRQALEAAQIAFDERPVVQDEAQQQRAAEMSDQLARLRRLWRDQRAIWSAETAANRRDAVRYVAPLQQLDGMLLQLERRMEAWGDAAYADQLRRRRLGLAAFSARLRNHLEDHAVLDHRAFQRAISVVDEVLGAPTEPTEATQVRAHALKVLRGGR